MGAKPAGKIAGLIVDGRQQAKSGAVVQASLQFTMLFGANPGGYNVNSHERAEHLGASSGADGRFEIAGLCKGAYLLKVTAPGRAWAERKVFIGPDLGPALVVFVMDQGDTIAGLVRDPDGKPIAGATVTPTRRQHYEGDELRYTVEGGGPEQVKTDDAGRFRFAGLQEGRYLIEVKATGFKPRELEPIPAGDGSVEVTLERLH